MDDFKLILGIIIGTIAIVVGGIFFVSRSSNKPKEAPKPVDNNILIRSDSKNYSSALTDTPVTIVEFGDFECPACGYAYPNVEKILSDYQGKVKLIFRHFPLDQHKNAMVASEAAEAAITEGKFYMMYQVLYSHQNEWGESSDPMQFFLKYADDLKMDKDKFKKFVEDKKGEEKIKKDRDDGVLLGVNATPTFFINGVKFTDNPTYENLKVAVDAALKASGK